LDYEAEMKKQAEKAAREAEIAAYLDGEYDRKFGTNCCDGPKSWPTPPNG
jgi:hypothetical protein